jgi:TonB family protein
VAAALLSAASAGAGSAFESGETETMEAPGFRVEYQNCDGSLPTADRLTVPMPLSTRYTGMTATVRVELRDGVPDRIRLVDGSPHLLEVLRWEVERARFALGEPACVLLHYRVTHTVAKAAEVIDFGVWVDVEIQPDGRIARADVAEELTDADVERAILGQVRKWKLEPGYLEDGEPAPRGTSLRVAVELVPTGWDVWTVNTSLEHQGPRPLKTTSPRFPPYARGGVAQGVVEIEFMVSAEGEPLAPTVVHSAPPGLFDDAALKTLRRWRYRPETVGGEPVATAGVRTVVEYDPARRPDPFRRIVVRPLPWELED